MNAPLTGRRLGSVSETTFTQQVNAAFKNYNSVLALSRSPLANSGLVVPALVLDAVSPTADERGRALRLLLRWAVEQLAPAAPQYPLDNYRPFDDPTWQDPHWWRYNILRHRYLEPLHPDDFVEGGRFTETLMALTGIPSPDTYFDERNRAIRDVAQHLRQQFVSGEADEALRQLALDEVLRSLRARPAALALLGVAATCDDVFPQRLLLQMAAQEPIADVAAALRSLTAHRFLLSGDDGTNLWLSPVVQAYLYRRQPKAKLRRRHRLAAQHYQAEQDALKAAAHWHRAGAWEQAAKILLAAAGELINELQINELCAGLCMFARDQLPPAQWREVQILLSDLYHRLGQQADALAACRQALKVTSDPPQQARIYRRMGKLYEKQNHLHALGYYQQAVERFRGHDPELPHLLKDRGWLYVLRQEWDQAESDLTLALSHAGESDGNLRADIHDALASLYRRRKLYDVAIRYAREALAIREEMGNLLRIAASCNNLGSIYLAMQDYPHAIAAYEEALVTYRKLSNREAIAGALLNIGSAHHLAGRLQQAADLYGQSLALCQEVGVPHLQVQALYNLAEVSADLGNASETRRYWQQGQALSVAHGFDGQIALFEQLQADTPALRTLAPGAAMAAETEDGEQEGEALAGDEQVALDLAAQTGQVTPRALMDATGMSKATATRRLADLVEGGYLQRHGKGRGTYYSLAEGNGPNLHDQVAQLLRQHITGLARGYDITAIGLATDAAIPLRLHVRFAVLPDLPRFFELEAHLSTLLSCEVNLKPVLAAPSPTTIHWIWTSHSAPSRPDQS